MKSTTVDPVFVLVEIYFNGISFVINAEYFKGIRFYIGSYYKTSCITNCLTNFVIVSNPFSLSVDYFLDNESSMCTPKIGRYFKT